METNPWKILNTKEIYQNPWIKVDEHKVLNSKGNEGIYGTIHFKNLAIGILPLDEYYNTWIVGQYRFPIKQYSWEIPEGGGNRMVPALESAQRELLEETGIIAKEYTKIQEMYLSNSASDERAILYLARKLEFVAPQPEESEVLQIKKVPFEELYQLVLKGSILDSLTVTAVLKIKLMMLKGEL
ncbi:MAG: NUDIX hydrolase [Bacteroidetes bacterium]|nr:NUDIX hydrolase [Bacteroidota bacterium]MBV6460013.1 hypothetical protein [Flavobacteriales bacterium]WKZ76343.1 MAG: NUDIX hydrolase [Vicingaceae bacterium]MCL4816265.1 NUDIX hydrolase [Flavobacteriales bacterium]NOG95408.1 NUDIX hydrolase [Bacteroidota bacterium]